jgi:hypothetical protein
MSFRIIGNLITHAGFENEHAAILKLGAQFTFEA